MNKMEEFGSLPNILETTYSSQGQFIKFILFAVLFGILISPIFSGVAGAKTPHSILDDHLLTPDTQDVGDEFYRFQQLHTDLVKKPEIIYILSIDNRQPSCLGCDYSFTEQASSPESAAIILWERKLSEGMWNSFSGRLYEIDLANMKIKRIKIPQIIFR